MRDIDLFIGGSFSASQSGERFEDIDPARGTPWASVALAGEDDVDHAVLAAKEAMRGPWGRITVTARCELLDAIADGVDARREEFLQAEIADTGKPASLARAIDIPRGAANFRVFADILRAHGTDAYHTDTRDGAGALNYSMRQPLGVVGVICPWNLPLLLMTWKVAPALAAGNTVVVKPSEETPATATLLGEVMRDVGVPDGVYNVVHGFGPKSAGEALVHHPDIRAITFTGETRTGEAIMKQAAEGLRKVSFELGGKNPAIVFADADFDAALAGTARSVFTNCGQICLCSERVYVQRLRLGDPLDGATNMGPLISAEHRDKVTEYFDVARDEGAEVIIGGRLADDLDAPFDGGFYVEPTIWTGLEESARCVTEEIFGPVCHIQPFDDEDEALAMANASPYGLCAAIWTQHLGRAHRVARQVEAGLVWVNDWFLRDLRTPFGGVKLSGIGREGGTHSLDFYSEIKNVCIKLEG